jgi:hypothetical protein
VPHSPTPVDLDGLFAYARVAARARRATEREVSPVADRTPRAPFSRGTAWPRTAHARRLAELGLVEPAPAAAVESEARDGAQLLERLGRVVRVATDALDGQLRSDALAARIAALAGAELRHAVFEHIAPDEGEPARDVRISSLPDDDEIPPDAPIVGLVRLRAHVGLASWEIFAIDRGPWLDLPAVLALLNTVLRHHASRTRFVVLRGEEPSARVLAARMQAIEAAVSEGLLELEGPDEALLRRIGGTRDSDEIRM